MRLYWENSYDSEFSARVVRAWSEANKHFVVLDQTLFYPAAGGQSADTGNLNGIAVLDVREDGKAKGDIIHQVATPLETGQEVSGQIDWARRYRHMQRHTAEHILGQAFLRAGNWDVLAVNMGSAVCTMDYSGEPDEKIVQQAEALANWAVYANTPTQSFFIHDDEVANYPLRRAPKVSGQIRVVEIEGWDYVACGGTHLRQTGEVGIIKILKFERHKGGTRIYFVAGWEALEDYSQKHAVVSRLGEKFSSAPVEIEKPIGNLRDEYYKLRGENMALRDELAEHLMRQLLGDFTDAEGNHTIYAQVSDNVLDAVGKRLAEWPNVLALLVSASENKARYVLLKHSSRPEDLQVIWKEILEPLGAKGGGALVKLGVLPPKAIHAAIDAFKAKFGL